MKLNYLTIVFDKSRNMIPDSILKTTSESEIDGWCSQLLSESAFMTEYILRATNKEMRFDCKRINFICTNIEPRIGIRDFESVHELDVPFDIAYFSYSPEKKKDYLFEFLTTGFRILCKIKNWDFRLFEGHLNILRESQYHVEFYLENRQKKNGNTVAKVFGIQTMFEATFYVDFIQKNKLVQRKPLMVTRTESMLYKYYIDHIVWVDSNTVAVYDFMENNVVYVSMNT